MGRQPARSRAAVTLACLAAALALLITGAIARAEPLPAGSGRHMVAAGGERIELHTYKPQHYDGGPILLVLHGLGANAAGYRDYAIPLADARGLLVVAPLFDRKRFPAWRYQSGGLVRDQLAAGVLQLEPRVQWTGTLILEIIEAVRTAEARPDLAYLMIGHSAGGQTLSRFAAFVPNTAQRILIANPSTYLWPSREERFPYGFGGLPAPLAEDAVLQRYLTQPVTVLLGTADVDRDANLNVRAGAERQGTNRYERGRNVFRAAQQLAQERGWAFRWELVEVPGVAHSARAMFGSTQAREALSGN